MISSSKNVHGALSIRKRDLPAQLPKDSSSVVRRRDAIVFLREFSRELVREISPVTKVIVLLCFVGLLTAGIYWGRAAIVVYRTQQQKNLSLIDAQGKLIDQHGAKLTNLQEEANRINQQIAALNESDSDLGKTGQKILDNLALAPTLWKSYMSGVCLIAGSYTFVEPSTGLPLRYPGEGLTDEERLLTTGTEVPLTPDGDGPIFELEFLGTGFHVGDGFILTNSHVVSRPWAADMHAQLVMADTGARPQLKKLLGYFPGQRSAYHLKVKGVSETRDVAVCLLIGTGAAARIPALPLDQEEGAIAVGKPVVMMGYPTGPNRMLALLSEDESLGVQQKYGGSLFVLLDQLSKRRLVKPLTTQGHITDLYTDRIVFDAATGEGSSGTPMFGESGRVIGITFAVFIENKASNFAVPMKSVIKLLKRAGWTQREVSRTRPENETVNR